MVFSSYRPPGIKVAMEFQNKWLDGWRSSAVSTSRSNTDQEASTTTQTVSLKVNVFTAGIVKLDDAQHCSNMSVTDSAIKVDASVVQSSAWMPSWNREELQCLQEANPDLQQMKLWLTNQCTSRHCPQNDLEIPLGSASPDVDTQ